MRTLLLRALAIAALLPVLARADDNEQALRTWGGLEKARVADLAAGKIVSEANASMKFARGISTKAAYIVAAPVSVTMDVLLNTDPTKEPEREVYQHHFFQAEDGAGFDKLKVEGSSAPIRKLREATANGKGLQLSAAEKAKLPKANTPAAIREFWSEVLRTRWKAATTSGDLGSTGTYDTRSEIRSLLGEEQKIATHFAGLLAPLSAAVATPLNLGRHWWFVSNINGTAGVQLGGSDSRHVGEQRQVMEVTYYSSFGYLASVSLYELTPVMVGDRKSTLVWQGSFASAVDLAGNFGLNRKIASTLMLRDVERSIRSFQKSAAAAAVK